MESFGPYYDRCTNMEHKLFIVSYCKCKKWNYTICCCNPISSWDCLFTIPPLTPLLIGNACISLRSFSSSSRVVLYTAICSRGSLDHHFKELVESPMANHTHSTAGASRLVPGLYGPNCPAEESPAGP